MIEFLTKGFLFLVVLAIICGVYVRTEQYIYAWYKSLCKRVFKLLR